MIPAAELGEPPATGLGFALCLANDPRIDAAGVLDPFSGEGQSAALASGILAAETVERHLSGELSREECERAYEEAWRRRFARRFAWSAAFRRLILNRPIGALAGRLAGERLIRFAISATRR